MHAHEQLVIAYFTAIAAAAPFSSAVRRRKQFAVLLSILTIISVVMASRHLPANARHWIPHVYLVVGYWAPALLVPSLYTPWFETWLLRTETAWRRPSIDVPAWAVQGLELAYLLCYVLVPAAFAVVWGLGTEADIGRFWLSILLSGYACYGTIPWLVSRPPRLVGGPPAPRTRIAAMNARLLSHVSHGLTTFPSGHVAVSTAATLAVFPVSAPAGIATGIVAVGIAIGAVVGGYHFRVDVVSGAAVGMAAALGSAYLSR